MEVLEAKKRKKRRSFKYLTYDERVKIESMLNLNIKIQAIAENLGYSRSAIYSELERCEKGRYSADAAQKSL